jgi:hypothetical protein
MLESLLDDPGQIDGIRERCQISSQNKKKSPTLASEAFLSLNNTFVYLF